MQRPPLYSALHVQGKRLYEYAREGKEVPVEIQERPVEVQELRIVEWLEGGSHQYKWPSQEAETEDKEPAEVVLHLQDIPGTSTETCKKQSENEDHSRKRRRTVDEEEDVVAASVPTRKSQQVEKTFCMSGGLQEPDPEGTENAKSEDPVSISQGLSSSEEQPPAVRLRMTVTSGFYVRSLAHDLGKAVDSLGCMSDLIRTTQENFQLGRNVLEWSDIKGGEEVWASKLETMLQDWQDRIEEPGDHEKPEPIPQSAIVWVLAVLSRPMVPKAILSGSHLAWKRTCVFLVATWTYRFNYATVQLLYHKVGMWLVILSSWWSHHLIDIVVRNSIKLTTVLLTGDFFLISALVIDKYEWEENDKGAKPVNSAWGLRIQEYLAYERERNCQAQTHCDNQRRRQQHCIGPADVRCQGDSRVDLVAVIRLSANETQVCGFSLLIWSWPRAW